MIPQILHRVWLGQNLPEQFSQWSLEMAILHPHWQSITWTEENIHQLGIEPFDYEHSTMAGASNIIRLHAVLKMGGIYHDFDIQPIQPFDCLLPHKAFAVRQDDPRVTCNAFFGAEPNHPWIKAQIDSYGDQRKYGADRGCYVMENRLTSDVEILPTHSVFSWNWDTPKEQQIIHPDALAIHHWAASWIDK
jgi:mannosyltransferase OCH1-like enzyme